MAGLGLYFGVEVLIGFGNFGIGVVITGECEMCTTGGALGDFVVTIFGCGEGRSIVQGKKKCIHPLLGFQIKSVRKN